jgi:hypothetical protein
MDAGTLEELKLLFDTEKGRDRYVVVSVWGLSRPGMVSGNCSLGTESNVIWIALTSKLRVRKIVSVSTGGCLQREYAEEPKIEAAVLRIEWKDNDTGDITKTLTVGSHRKASRSKLLGLKHPLIDKANTGSSGARGIHLRSAVLFGAQANG